MTMIGMMISDYQVRKDGKGVRARDDQQSSDDVLVRKTHTPRREKDSHVKEPESHTQKESL